MKKGLLKSIALSCSAMFIIGMSGLPVYAENTTSKNLTKEEAFQQIYERLADSIEDIKISANGDRIVDGFARIWSLDSSFTSGQFTSECYGSAYPNNRMSTYMYIK